MSESKTTRLFNLFFLSGLQFKAEWNGNRIAAIVVAHRYRRVRDVPKPGTETLPQPSEEQLKTIMDVLDAQELEVEEVPEHDCVDEVIISLRAARYTRRA